MFDAQTTKVAVIADIHGNVDALKAVLEDISGAGLTHIINLGDHFSGPLAAAETLDVLRQVPMVNLRGNHDRWLMQQALDDMGPSDRVAAEELGPDGVDWLSTLPANATPLPDIFACHATPVDDLTYWLHDVRPSGRVVTRSATGIERYAAAVPNALMVCGHTHLQGLATLSDGRRVMNPGSVGLPAYDDDNPAYHVMEAGSPEARYARLFRRGGVWDIDFRTVQYDASRMIDMASTRGRAGWAHALRTGRMPQQA